MKKIHAQIIGGAGYTAGELIRLLIHHPRIGTLDVHSESQQGKAIHEVHHDILGYNLLPFNHHISHDADVYFICSGHGKAKEILQQFQLPAHSKIIDLSHDHRYHPTDHSWQYGLSELFTEDIQQAQKIANPGCFATSILLPLLPLLKTFHINDVHIHAITGSTGAGVKPSSTTHFSYRSQNLSSYKSLQHQHEREIIDSFKASNTHIPNLFFIPIRGTHTRGIYSSMTFSSTAGAAEMYRYLSEYYAPHPFIHVSTQDHGLKAVVNTNNAAIHIQGHDEKVHITCAIDNLLKGASGQAVQNMNIQCNIPQTEGLRLKSLAY